MGLPFYETQLRVSDVNVRYVELTQLLSIKHELFARHSGSDNVNVSGKGMVTGLVGWENLQKTFV